MSLESILNALQLRRTLRRTNHGPALRRPRFETLEDRCLLSLTAVANYSAGAEPHTIVTADFNNDGRLDLAVANSSSDSVSVLLGNGNGTFQPAQTSAAGDNPVSLAVGDFNSDGTLDLAAADGGARGVNVMFGNGAGAFLAPTHIPVGFTEHGQRGPGSLATGDFNGDGKMDLVVTSNYRPPNYYSYPQGLADVLLAVGDGSFREPRRYWSFDRALGAAVVTDFNGDGKQDLVTELPDYTVVIVLLGDGQGNIGNYLGAGSIAAFSSNPSAAADLDGDGNIDLVSAPRPHEVDASIGVMLGDGNDGFLSQGAHYHAVGGTPGNAALGDFNQDGMLDIATAIAANDEVSILRGRGGVAFETVERFAVGLGGSAAPTADFSEDGAVDGGDLIQWSGDYGINDDSDADGDGDSDGADFLAWQRQLGSSSTVENLGPYGVAAGDFNGDGWLDLATANAIAGSVSVLINDKVWPVLPPAVSIDYATVTEGDVGTTSATFTVSLSKVTDVDVTVHYSTADSGAVAGSDYLASSGDVVILAGQTSGTFTVTVIGDRLAEPDEYFFVSLSDPINATIANGEGAGIILDDEPRISISDAAVTEGNTGTLNATFTVSLSASSSVDVTVHYSTADQDAVAGSDYTAASGDVVIPAGQTSGTFTVAIVGDRLAEPTEAFAVNLSDATNAIISDGLAFCSIVDDEPRISINNVFRSEGNGNKTTLFTFTVTLSSAYDQSVTMSYRTEDDTAMTSGNDYIAKIGALSFAPGETTKTITIEVKGDNAGESHETFYLDLFDNSINSQFTKNRGVGTIWNDDN